MSTALDAAALAKALLNPITELIADDCVLEDCPVAEDAISALIVELLLISILVAELDDDAVMIGLLLDVAFCARSKMDESPDKLELVCANTTPE